MMSDRIDISFERLEELLVLEHLPEYEDETPDVPEYEAIGWNAYRDHVREVLSRLRDGA